ncbi:hypothetical protein HZS_1276 [Henneguya salminicola]|nr:hypothetical protein HZS_1276 [Henneguya salminicola]
MFYGSRRDPESKILLGEVRDRTEITLVSIIRTHMFAGSIVIADCFRNPVTEFHTNTIEGFWNAFKEQVSHRNMTNSFDREEIWLKIFFMVP